MRVLLQQPPAPGVPTRFCRLTLEADLFGAYNLLRETGEIGGRSQVRRSVHIDREQALAAFEQARDREIKRGFRISDADPALSPTPSDEGSR